MRVRYAVRSESQRDVTSLGTSLPLTHHAHTSPTHQHLALPHPSLLPTRHRTEQDAKMYIGLTVDGGVCISCICRMLSYADVCYYADVC
jgi:hypothetical protein